MERGAAGRVTRVTDETGTTAYRYGLLGQVEEEARVIRLLPLSGGKTKTASMKYESNYLGQMEKIEYPDGETVSYAYNWGGQISKVTGIRKGTEFPYVKDIGYDEYGQRLYIEYGSGVKTKYSYDPYRRWLSSIRTESPEMGHAFQDIKYKFDAVGNVLEYANTAYGYTTTQNYAYDGLYQLIEAKGASRSHPYGSGTEYTTDYRQDFSFNKIGNMTKKLSEEYVSNTNRIGANLNYNLDYTYYAGTHMAERIGSRYYDYDRNGNVVAEREGGHAATPEVYRPYYRDGDLYYTEYGFGLVRPNPAQPDDQVYQRNYRWNERNLLSESSDSVYTVQYRYGADGQRALKFTANSGRSTVYFNKMWQVSDAAGGWLQSKHIYVNEDRITTKYNSEGNENTLAEKERTYYYHSDHLGSAQTVTNHKGQVHERLEYTPYGELWIDWQSDLAPEDSTPFRFTGKEPDAETGLYYYGARYLDPKTSRWLSGDPAMGEYLPVAPVNDDAKKHNGNLPGMGGVFNYANLHAYHYAGNNPVKYVDPDGEIIHVPDKAKRKEIERMINSVSFYRYKFDEAGDLVRDGNKRNGFFGLGRSREFSDRLQEAIDITDKTIFISMQREIPFIPEDGSLVFKNPEEGGGGRTIRNFAGLILIGITGENSPKGIKMKDGTSKIYTPQEILVHELVGHAIPMITDRNGNAIENENKVRSQMGWKERDPNAVPDPCF